MRTWRKIGRCSSASGAVGEAHHSRLQKWRANAGVRPTGLFRDSEDHMVDRGLARYGPAASAAPATDDYPTDNGQYALRPDTKTLCTTRLTVQ